MAQGSACGNPTRRDCYAKTSNPPPFTYRDVLPCGYAFKTNRGIDTGIESFAREDTARGKVVIIVGSPLRLDASLPPIFAIGYVTKCNGKNGRFIYVTHSFDKEYEVGDTVVEELWQLAVPRIEPSKRYPHACDLSTYVVCSKTLAPLIVKAESDARKYMSTLRKLAKEKAAAKKAAAEEV